MPDQLTAAEPHGEERKLVLGIDTCGPMGSVALARLSGDTVEVLGQRELEGRSYSATLVSAVGELLGEAGIRLAQLGAIVVTSGPGSFTGVRVGLSAVKGLAEPAGIPVVAVSRLEVLTHKVGVLSAAALDAHRHEVFLRIAERELLAGVGELASLGAPDRIAVCDESAEALLRAAWPQTELIRTAAPTAADALEMALPRILAGESEDLALLDGHYLRRSDAEIFGDSAVAARTA
jgi:tRNA threonylcarbamoyladenosine biosynthesis protein TsaB